jgi:hypothetical protein
VQTMGHTAIPPSLLCKSALFKNVYDLAADLLHSISGRRVPGPRDYHSVTVRQRGVSCSCCRMAWPKHVMFSA